ncbi:UDP-glucose/GDP-mannose dehydrogenase family protein [Christensenellaceae bacterium OttesenSCG-928-K19]|nr:UDP-glucose/GDP-mannose dehydrogenase family protein [Christensenellaceae bacterium OttesenSCG-928-K19]
MRITVVGTGYVGLIAGLGFANFGNDVICLDVVPEKIEKLEQGICPIYEPGADEILERNLAAGRIRFTLDVKEAMEHGQLIFIAVGTPESPNGEADLTYVFEAARNVGRYMQEYKVVVDKSTVPVGTSEVVAGLIKEELQKRDVELEFDVASNPEFLREGKALQDFLYPDRIVLGVDSKKAEDLLIKSYSAFKRARKPFVITTPKTAEMIKYASNAFLAVKITFINEMAELCEKVGANALEVASAMGKDGRISPKFLHPGPGYGGSCFPKDTKAVSDTAKKYGARLSLVDSAIESNEYQKDRSAQKIIDNVPEGEIGILGLAFKPETDDIRESPAIWIVKRLLECGKYTVRLYDPQAMKEFKALFNDVQGITWCEQAYDVCKDAQALAVVTDWDEFKNMDFDRIKSVMQGDVVFDFRNIYIPDELKEKGFRYFGTGV